MLFRPICALLLWSQTTVALPQATTSSTLDTRVTCPAKNNRQFLPNLRTINDATTDPNVFHVANDTAGSSVSQVMTFANFPVTATEINLYWAQSVPPHDFTATGAAVVDVYFLDSSKSPVDGTLTPEIVSASIDTRVGPYGTGKIGAGGFAGWPAVQTQQDHLVGAVNATATSELSFLLVLQDTGDVRLMEDAQNGWFLSYNC